MSAQVERLQARVDELETGLDDVSKVASTWFHRAEAAEARIAELENERHSTNEALSRAVEENHEKGQRIAELEAALVAATGKTYSEAARLLEHTGRDDDAVNLLDNMAAAFEPGGSAAVSS